MMCHIPNIICVSLLLLYANSWTRAEFFTAVAQMEPLLALQKGIIDALDEYIMKEEKRIATLKRHLRLYKIEHAKAMEDISNYLWNPINAFTLIKRLTTDLNAVHRTVKLGITYIDDITTDLDGMTYPSMEDLAGAAQALIRLQTVYQLRARDLAAGHLNGVQYSHSMTAADCFEVARAVYVLKDFNSTIVWSIEALRKMKKEQNLGLAMTENDILEYIVFSHFFMGDVKGALEWSNTLLTLDPNNARAHSNILHFKKAIIEQQRKKKQNTDMEEKTSKVDAEIQADYDVYSALCRGEGQIPSEIAKRLRCRYLTEHHPFLRLAPIKMEQVYINPDVYIFHQVISEEEIELIKHMSLPRLKRAMVRHPKTGDGLKVLYRISKSAWLYDSDNEVIARLSQRVGDMTGLSMLTAEPLQVVNYGIGGHYEPHYDFIVKDQETGNFKNNRIATVMFYMSDVSQGGATVFTDLGLSVFPVKGAALFWMNLHPSGEGDTATRHAACPVLRGSKWVGNIWLHQVGQEFLRPCTLEYQEEDIFG